MWNLLLQFHCEKHKMKHKYILHEIIQLELLQDKYFQLPAPFVEKLYVIDGLLVPKLLHE